MSEEAIIGFLLIFLVSASMMFVIGLKYFNKELAAPTRKKKEWRILTVSVPSETPWQPTPAVGFATSLFHLGHPVTLQIVGNRKGITWQIKLPRAAQDVVTRSLLSFYPQADIITETIDSTIKEQQQSKVEEVEEISVESKSMDWVQEEDRDDKTWIHDNLATLSAFAREHFVRSGRGAVVVQMAVPNPLNDEETFWYKPQNQVVSFDAESESLVEQYNLENEMVVIVLTPKGTTMSYVTSLVTSTTELAVQIAARDDENQTEKQRDQSSTSTSRSASVKDIVPADGNASDEDMVAAVSHQTRLGSTSEFFVPLVYAQDCKSFDPLTGIVGAMSNLIEGETVTYQLEITPTDHNYRKEGFKKIRKDPMLYLAGGILTTALDAGLALDHAVNNPGQKRRPLPQVKAPDSLDKFESDVQRLFESKLNAPLLPASMSLHVQSRDEGRLESIIDGLYNATGAFDRNGGNVITVGDNRHPLVLTPQEVAALWHLPTEEMKTPGIVRASGAKAALPVELMDLTDGTHLGYNTYQGQTRPVYLATEDRVTHMNIVGKTRVGKTTFMHNLIEQDIVAGRGVGVIDPHGDLVRDILESSIPPERANDVVLFDLADTQHPLPLNLLYVPPSVPRHAAVGLTLGVLKKIFADQWSATRMEDALYSALSILVDVEGATIRDIPKLFLNQDYRTAVLAHAHDEVALEYWHEEFEQMSERYQMEVARPIMTRIRAFYRNPVIRNLVDQPGSIDLRSIMDERKIFLVSLAGEATQAEAATIGALLIAKIQMAAMSRANIPIESRRMFYLYIDEVQNFITTSLPVMFSEAGKYALSLTIANQFLRQLAGDTFEAVIGNTGTTVMFGCGVQDAKDLGPYVKPVFDAETLMNLDRFQTVVKMQQNGKTLPAFSMQTPPPPARQGDARERAERIREGAQDKQGAYRQTDLAVKEKPAPPDLLGDPQLASDRQNAASATDNDDTIPSLDL